MAKFIVQEVITTCFLFWSSFPVQLSSIWFFKNSKTFKILEIPHFSQFLHKNNLQFKFSSNLNSNWCSNPTSNPTSNSNSRIQIHWSWPLVDPGWKCTLYFQVETVQQYNEYCHYVAGLVGIGLSDLFQAANLEDHVDPQLSNAMGLFLQVSPVEMGEIGGVREGEVGKKWKETKKRGKLVGV